MDRGEDALLEYDGNRQTIRPSGKLKYLEQIKCDHYVHPVELGDPFLT